MPHIYQSLQLQKKLVSCLLVMMVLFNACGYYLLFNLIQNEIKREIRAQIRAGLENKDLVVISITEGTEKELNWLEAGKEFIYRGEMYDVVKLQSAGNHKVYYCIHDFKEKKLITDFARRNNSNQKARLLFSSISNHFIIQTGNRFYALEPLYHEFGVLAYNILPEIIELSDPPPKS